MSKHTPGPWSVFRRDGYATYIHAINEGDEINTFQVASCNCATSRKYFPKRGEAEANARLIASAPGLLETLKAAYSHAVNHDESLPFDWANYCEMLHSAILKAEGGQA